MLSCASGCRSKSEPPAARPAASASGSRALALASSSLGAASRAVASPPSRPPGRRGSDLRSLVCRARAECATLETVAAGADTASGRERLVVPVRIGPAVHGSRDEECVPHELWLVTTAGPTFEVEQLLYKDCTREAPWPVEMTVRPDGEVIVNRGGYSVPSNWFGSVELWFGSSPPSFDRYEAGFGFRLSPCPAHSIWSSDDGFTALVTWRKTAVERNEPFGFDDACSEERNYVPIPLVALPSEFELGGFRTFPFDRCSTAIDGGTGVRGVTLVGPEQDGRDATLRAVLSEQAVLYLDVSDDHFVGAPDDPEPGDHVEVWTSPQHDSYTWFSGQVLEEPSRYRIRVADGRVFGADGGSAPLSVVRAARPGRVVLRIRLPVSPEKLRDGGLSVLYVDVDPGEPKRIIGTSRVDARTASSLGVAQPPHHGVTCRVDGGELVRAVPVKGRDEPLADYMNDP